MVFIMLAACATPQPLDVHAALSGSCDGRAVAVADASHLAVFEGPPPRLAVNVVLHDELVVDGAAVELEELTDVLAEKAAVARDLRGRAGDPELTLDGELLLQVAATTQAGSLVQVLRAIEASEFRQIQFVGRSATQSPEPVYADPTFGALLEATRSQPPERRARAYNAATEGVLEACPALMTALNDRKRRPYSERCASLPDVIEASLRQCPDAAPREIVTLFQYDPMGGGHTLTTVSRRLGASAPPFTVQPTETWAAIVPRLQATGPTMSWVLELSE